MNRTKIAIDLNDVLRAYTAQFASLYKKGIDNDFDIDNVEITTNNLMEVFPFDSEEEYQDFVYVDYPYELFACAEPMSRQLQFRLHQWLSNDLRNIDEDEFGVVDVMAVSPFEINMTIQSTLYFLHKIASRIREYYFPIDSLTIWDKCDVLVTANPWLIENKPQDKIVIRIDAPYNKPCEADLEFNSFMDLMQGGVKTIEEILNKLKNKE